MVLLLFTLLPAGFEPLPWRRDQGPSLTIEGHYFAAFFSLTLASPNKKASRASYSSQMGELPFGSIHSGCCDRSDARISARNSE